MLARGRTSRRLRREFVKGGEKIGVRKEKNNPSRSAYDAHGGADRLDIFQFFEKRRKLLFASGAVLHAIQNFFDVLFPGGGIVVSSHFIRKAAHFSEYALLGAMLFFTYRSYTVKWKTFFIPALLAAAVPFLDEGLQFFSEGRSPQLTDVGIDLAGALFGMLFAWAVLYVAAAIRRKRRKKEK